MLERGTFKRLFRLAIRRDAAQDVARELGFHLEMRARDLTGRGMDPGEADVEARRLFGDVESIQEVCRRIDERARRDERQGQVMDTLRQDVAFAVRSMVKHPGFTTIAVATLALGIGANTAIFSVVQAVLLRPLPYENSERIVRAWANADDGTIERFSFRKLEYSAFADLGTSFDVVGGDFAIDITLTGDGVEPERIKAAYATPGYFEVFGVIPRLGRTFTQADVDGDNPLVAVVTHGFWIRRLGADPNAVGRTIATSSIKLTVLGVLPETFRQVEGEAEIFIPYTIGTERWIARWLYMYARLKPDVAPERAAEEMTALVRQIGEATAGT